MEGAYVDQTRRNDCFGPGIYDSCRPEDRDTARARVQAVFQTGKPGQYEGPGLTLDDQEHWYASYHAPIYEGGKVIAVSVISVNVADHKRADRALLESEARTRCPLGNQETQET